MLNRSRGFTLIELMVALVLGLVVVGGVMGVFISTYQSNSQNIKAIRLNEEMRAVMGLISRDIRRAGIRELAWQPSLLGSANPFSTATAWVVSDMGAVPDACIRLAYSVTNDNGTAPANLYGYRLNTTTGAVDMYNHNAGQWNCNGTGWQPVSDPDIAWIQSLVFTVSTEPGMSGVAVRTVVVTLRAATHTRSTDPSNLTAADCSNIDVVCREIEEKIRVRNDAIL